MRTDGVVAIPLQRCGAKATMSTTGCRTAGTRHARGSRLERASESRVPARFKSPYVCVGPAFQAGHAGRPERAALHEYQGRPYIALTRRPYTNQYRQLFVSAPAG